MDKIKTKIKIEKILIVFGMISTIFYFSHTIIGNLLWKEYNPITTDISSLTAVGAPNANLLTVLVSIYGVLSIIFAIGILVRAYRIYNNRIKAGYIVLLIMQLVSLIGYGLFPLTGDKSIMTFQNMMHIIVTVIVVFTTILFSFLLASGYKKQEQTKKFGKFLFVAAILITVFGSFNPISMAMKLNVLGLSERMVIYTLQILMFSISYYETFKIKY